MQFIYSPLWQAIGAILFAAIMFTAVYGFYMIQPRDEDDDYAWTSFKDSSRGGE